MARFYACIPTKLPGLNDYIRECRANRYAGAKMKQDTEALIAFYLRDLPELSGPVRITFVWTEGNARRDLDNVAFAKKFILDALVKTGKLPNDDRWHVLGFSDQFRQEPGTWDVGVIIDTEGET